MSEQLHIPQKFAGSRIQYPPETNPILRASIDAAFRQLAEQDRQNWLEIERFLNRQVTPATGLSTYNAIVDPGLPTDAASHRYINFNDLVANETWASPFLFQVGVVVRGDATPVLTASNVTFPGPVAIEAAPLVTSRYGNAFSGNPTRQVWDFQSSKVGSSQYIFIRGMNIRRSTGGAVSSILGGGNVWAENCVFEGIDNGSTQRFSSVTSAFLYAQFCTFYEITYDSVAILEDCHLAFFLNTTITLNGDNLWIHNGSVRFSTARTVTLGGTSKIVDIQLQPDGTSVITGGASSAAITWSITNTGETRLSLVGSASNPWNITVGAGAGPAIVESEGAGTITVSGNTNNNPRKITGSCTKLVLTGDGINASPMDIRGAAIPLINLVACNDSYVQATVFGPAISAATNKAVAIDANSHRSVVFVIGQNSGNFVASTNVSTAPVSVIKDELNI